MTKTVTDKNLIKADIFRVVSRGFSYPSAENISFVREISNELIASRELKKNLSLQIKKIISNINEEEIQNEYSRLFLKKIVPINESFCCSRLNAITDVAGFYKAFGMAPKSGDAPDALPYELEFAALLLTKFSLASTNEQKEITRTAFEKFLKEHLNDFVSQFSQKIKDTGAISYYLELLVLLRILVTES